MSTVIVERVLNGFDAVKPQSVSAFGQGDALLIVIGRAAVTGAKGWEKIDAEFHAKPLSELGRRWVEQAIEKSAEINCKLAFILTTRQRSSPVWAFWFTRVLNAGWPDKLV
jgi:hypothetical protein